MSTTADPLLETLVNDFGGNYVFALDLLEQYRQDRRSVDATWRAYFDKALGLPPEAEQTPVTVIVNEAPKAAPAAAPGAGLQTLARQDVPVVAAGDRSKAVARVSILPGDILQPIRGGAVRIVENMEASLQIPTATSARTIPVRTLEENRRLLNKHREAAGQGKVSFTHLVAWAILRSLDTFPRMNDAYAEVDGQPHRIQRDQVRLGIAVDVQKKDGSRTLLVPNIKDAQKLSFAEFLKAFDDLVARSRKGTISPDDFMGTTVSLTNPGTVGHHLLRAAPHAGPGRHRRDRHPRLPGRVQVDGPAHAGAPRHQQGDDGDVHLRPPHHPGRRVGPLPRPHGRAAQGRGRLLRPRLRGPRPAAPAGQVGDGREPCALRDARRSRGGREADEGPAAHPQLPRARPPGGRPRPARPRPRAAP